MTASDRERLARVALGTLGEPGDPRLVSLVAELGPVLVHDQLAAGYDAGDGVQDDIAARLVGADPARDLERAERAGIRFVVPGDDEWPTQVDQLLRTETLRDRGGPPLGLWVRGPMGLDELESSVAVVGSRSATSYGTTIAGEIAAVVARAGYPVVSGAAFGIDQAAHRGALAAGGRTVAVLACGVDLVYPPAHHRCSSTSRRPAPWSPSCHRAVVSRIRFLSRNRLIAALTRGTVVVEAAARSGALNTAGWAARLYRPLMSVPGPVTAAQSEGTHELLRKGGRQHRDPRRGSPRAGGRERPAPRRARRGRRDARDRLPPRQQQVLDAVPSPSRRRRRRHRPDGRHRPARHPGGPAAPREGGHRREDVRRLADPQRQCSRFACGKRRSSYDEPMTTSLSPRARSEYVATVLSSTPGAAVEVTPGSHHHRHGPIARALGTVRTATARVRGAGPASATSRSSAASTAPSSSTSTRAPVSTPPSSSTSSANSWPR